MASNKRGYLSAFNMPSGFDAPQPQVELDTPCSPALFVPGQWPSDDILRAEALEHEAVPRSSFLSAISNWAPITAVKGLLIAPVRLARLFFRRQNIVIQPIVREDGARKKRIIDAGFADVPVTPSPKHKVRGRRAGHISNNSTSSPDIWLAAGGTPSPVEIINDQPASPDMWLAAADTPSPVKIITDQSASPDIWLPSPSPIRQATEQLEEPQYTIEDEEDAAIGNIEYEEDVTIDSIDMSWSDIWTGTPLLPSTRSPSELSPNTHMNIINKSSVTPVHKLLLRAQTLRKMGQGVRTSPGNHTRPVVSPVKVASPTPLQKQAFKLQQQRLEAQALERKIREEAEARAAEIRAQEQREAELRAAEQARYEAAYYNFVETVDQDLSTLPDAPDEDPNADITLHTPSPLKRALSGKKSVSWAEHAKAKPFYYDTRVTDMLDSTLELIASSPIKRDAPEGDDNVVDDQKITFLPESTDSHQPASGSDDPPESVGFTGVPPETWEDSDDSLEESQISLELLEDLQAAFQNKISLESPSKPIPAIKALVQPLGSEELDLLMAVVTKTQDGADPTQSIVDQKLNVNDFSTLLPDMFKGDPRAWLNDNIVNEYLDLLVEHKKKEAGFEGKRGGPAPPIHAFSSFWYPTAKKDLSGVKRWANRFHLGKEKLLDVELLLYPICDAGHWRLLAVKPKERTIEYLDSLGCDGSKYISKMKEYLAQELTDHYVAEEWTVLKKQRSSRQSNCSDCGVFTVLNALALIRGEELSRVLSCDGMYDARERIAVTLLNGIPTSEFE